MHSINDILGMIASNAAETGGERDCRQSDEEPIRYCEIYSKSEESLPKIHYTLEVIRNSDGSITWYE